MGSSTDLIKLDDLNLAALDKDSELAEILDEALAGEGVNAGDLERVKWPSGGAVAFERTILGEKTYDQKITGVIVHQRMTRAYWQDPTPKEGSEPDCSSPDGKYGFGAPGDTLRAQNPPVGCAACPMAQFGSARDEHGNQKRGQACNLRREFFMLTEGAIFPLMVSIPPASLGEGKGYVVDLASFGIRYYTVVTELSLQKATSKSGEPYAEAVLKMVGKLDDDAKEAIAEYRGRMLDTLTATRAFDVEGTAEPAEPAPAPGKGEDVPE